MDTLHRPWPLPPDHWIMAQTWHDLLFAHWPLPVERLRKLVPAVLPLDTYEGQAWIGVVPFWMSGVRLRYVPSLPWLSTFPELNVRTYVTRDGKPGVFFFSLDADNRLAVAIARRWYHLPYFRARMTVRERDGAIVYHSRRLSSPPYSAPWMEGGVGRGDSDIRPSNSAQGAEFVGSYQPTGPVFSSEPGSLAHWLTERYCFYAVDSRERVYRGEIHHPPWPLQPAAAEIAVNTMTAPVGLALPDRPPLLHFARRLDVRIWAPRRV